MARPRGAWLVAVAIGCLAFAFGSGTVRGQGPSLSPELEQLRLSLQKYQDPVVALRDGYFSTLGCVEYPKPGGQGQVAYQAGAMGIHFLNPSLISPATDPKRTTLLLYEPDARGKLTLVGAEWFVPLAMGIKERPQLFGRDFDGPMERATRVLERGLDICRAWQIVFGTPHVAAALAPPTPSPAVLTRRSRWSRAASRSSAAARITTGQRSFFYVRG